MKLENKSSQDKPPTPLEGEQVEDWSPKCPKCGESLDTVKVFVLEENMYYASPDPTNDSGVDWSVSEVIEGSEDWHDVECPYCNSAIAPRMKYTSEVEDWVKKFFTKPTGEAQ